MRLFSKTSFSACAYSKLSLSRLVSVDARSYSRVPHLTPAESVAHILQNEFGGRSSSPSSTTCEQKAAEPTASCVNDGVGRAQFKHHQQDDNPQLEIATLHPPMLGQDSHECKQQGFNIPRVPDLALKHGNADSPLVGHASLPLRGPDAGYENGSTMSTCMFENVASDKHAHAMDPSIVARQRASCTRTSQDIIRLLVDRVNAQSWIALNKDIHDLNIEIKPKEVAWVLKVLKNPNRARELFIWAAQRPGYAHDAACYAIMIDSLGDVLDHVFLNNLLAEMEKKNIQFNVSTVNKLIGIFASSDEFDRAEHYFLKLQNLKIQPNAFTYKCMLQAFAKAGICRKALDIYTRMQKERQPIDLVSYNILLDGLSRNGQAESAWKIFEEMKCQNYPVDVYTYTIMARSYGQAQMADKALDLLEEMVKNGVEPNKHTYNTVLDALSKVQGKLGDAVTIFKKMYMSGIYPDVVSCQSILKVLCKGRAVGVTLELTLSITNISVRKEVCESFIKGLAKMGHFQDARALFKIIKADNLQPSLATHLSMIDALCRGGEPNEAMVILKEVESKAGTVPLATYNNLLAALRKNDQFQLAYDLFTQIKERGPSPDVVSYNIIISGLIKMRQLPHAERLFKEMDSSGCRPNGITFNSLLHSYARIGDASAVRKILQMMHAKEVTPDVITYNCTIECFGKAGKPKVALKIFKEMKEKGVSPSFVTYNNVLLALADVGLTDKALSVFEQMKDHGFVPDALTFSILRRVYNSDPNLDKKQLTEEIRKAGLAYEISV